jgi:cytochrome b6-f complex iron-sulfur subunit
MAEEAAELTQADEIVSVPLSRREFLYYLWGASMAVFTAGSVGATIWFIVPRFRAGEFGGVFRLPTSEIPPADSGPKEFPQGRFWLVNIGGATLNDDRQPSDYPIAEGVRAIVKVCTHLGCLYKWNTTNDRFQCPCHGSKFLKSGTRIGGPARRNLDQFIIEVIDADGNVLTRTEPSMGTGEGTAVEIGNAAVALDIDTGRIVRGAPNSKLGGGL